MARDPSLTVSIRPYSWYVRDATTSATFAALVSGALGALALVLASIGMFGVLSYWVQQRQQDISVRMALGAAPMHVVRLVLGTTGCAVGWGLGVGLVLAVGAAQLLRSNLFGLSPMDPASYAGAMGVLALAAIVATLLPVRRAVRIEPMQALRGD
jgi:ABC-type antimicrobial peptide transport system permease subunit